MFKETVTCQILLKALMNLPNTDFILCKCLISENFVSFQSVSDCKFIPDVSAIVCLFRNLRIYIKYIGLESEILAAKFVGSTYSN